MGKSAIFTLLLIASFCNIHIQAALTWLDYEVAGFDNSDGELFKTNIKYKRFDKTTFGVMGTAEIMIDLSNDWEAELVIFHSAHGNNQFVKMPYKVPKDVLCNIVDGIFIKCGAAKSLAEKSNFPAPKENESLCASYKKGIYTIEQFLLSKDTIPKFLPTGYYKAQFTATKKNSTNSSESTFVLHVKLY